MTTTTNDPRIPGTTMPGSTTMDTTTFVSGGSHTHRRISWAAIFGGVILVVARPAPAQPAGRRYRPREQWTPNAGITPPPAAWVSAAGLWWVSAVALRSSSAATSRPGWRVSSSALDGVLHGLVTWGIATLLTFWLLTSAIGGIIGGGFSALGSVASAAGSGVSSGGEANAQAAGVSPDRSSSRHRPTCSRPIPIRRR